MPKLANRGYRAALRYGKVLLGKLPRGLAKDRWCIWLFAALLIGMSVVPLCFMGCPKETTGSKAVVDRPVTSADRVTHYPASFESIDYKPIQGDDTMSFNRNQLRAKIKAVLTWLDPEIPYSDTAVELLMLTCAQETHLGKYLKQVRGPARGIFQIEPATEKDMFRTLSQRHGAIRAKISELMFQTEGKGFTNMELNLAYQIAMARYFYYRVPKALPANDIVSMATYWKKYFNTYLGKGKVIEAIDNYERYCV